MSDFVMPTMSNFSLSVIALLALMLMWRWTLTHENFDLTDLITGDNGKVSGTKFTYMGGWIVGTWGFVTLIQQGKMTEYYFVGYFTVCLGMKVAKDIFAKQGTPQ